MQSIWGLSALAIPAILGCALANSDAPEAAYDTTSTAVVTTVSQGLKPPSELALLMRDMVAFSDSTKTRLQRGDELLPYPEQFAALHTATPTDGKLEMDKAMHDAFSDYYLAQVKSLYEAAPADRDRIFNGTLTACGNCHLQVCPGPMVKIKKMYVAVE